MPAMIADMKAIIGPNYKLILDSDTLRSSVYQRGNDLDPVLKMNAEKILRSELLKRVQAWDLFQLLTNDLELNKDIPVSIENNEEILEQLRALGYH